MTASAPRNRKLAGISDQLYRASMNAQNAFAHLNEQRALVSAIKSSTTDGAGGTTSGYSDRTLATMIRLDEIETKRQALHEAIDGADDAAGAVEAAIMDAYRAKADRDDKTDLSPISHDDRPLCRGGTPDTWGDPECGAHVEHFIRDDGSIGFRTEGLCSKHRTAKRRWEQQNREVA